METSILARWRSCCTRFTAEANSEGNLASPPLPIHSSIDRSRASRSTIPRRETQARGCAPLEGFDKLAPNR
jgi:hypothetical protein